MMQASLAERAAAEEERGALLYDLQVRPRAAEGLLTKSAGITPNRYFSGNIGCAHDPEIHKRFHMELQKVSFRIYRC